MSSTFRRLLATAALAAAPLAPSHAALVPVDAGFGAGSGTLDTASGLVFLDMSITTGLTYFQVLSALAPAGMLNGFRYATVPEVADMFSGSGVYALNPISDTPAADEAAFQAVVSGLLGIPAVDAGIGNGDLLRYAGLTGDPAGGAVPARLVQGVFIDRFTIDPMASGIFPFGGGFLADGLPAMPGAVIPPGSGVAASGSWLVQISAVPSPSVGSLGLAALLAWSLLAVVQRRGRTPG